MKCKVCKEEIKGIWYLVKYQVIEQIPVQEEILCQRCTDELLEFDLWSFKSVFSNDPQHASFNKAARLLIEPIFKLIGIKATWIII